MSGEVCCHEVWACMHVTKPCLLPILGPQPVWHAQCMLGPNLVALAIERFSAFEPLLTGELSEVLGTGSKHAVVPHMALVPENILKEPSLAG